MGRQAVTISFRLGGDDGVSVEARKWTTALRELGFETRRVAGQFEDDGDPDDVEIPGLRIEDAETADTNAIRAAIDGADLVIVDNICSLPLNVGAARAVASVVATHGGRVCFRHHDLPWQRRHLAQLEQEFPPRAPADALHATVNLRSRRELEARGYNHAATIHNYFDLSSQDAARASTRAEFGFGEDEFVVFQPARAIERKNVPGGLRFAQRLQALDHDRHVRYWLTGPAEDGYAPTLERLVARAPLEMTLGRARRAIDAYAAADLVVFPSTWEGFGNPVIESIAARRACAAYPYPVLSELVAAGIRVFSTESPENLAKFLAEPDDVQQRYFDVNVHRARISFDITQLPAAIDEAFRVHGWHAW
ncbi:MAG TPA: glycosyltransferase family 4 protein [Acidimicrobiia bacterium]|jgi:glycosyltransferase involved in cell wall biosynthesis|nr:glycosyltransferase family 4 protein [Acidimicrobiia bacterium]